MLATYRWLGRTPLTFSPQLKFVTAGFKIAIAEETLCFLEANVKSLEQAVAKQIQIRNQIQQKYEQKQAELQTCEYQLMTVENREIAEQAFITIHQLHNLIPQLAEQTRQAEEFVQLAKHLLSQEQEKLKEHKADLQAMQDLLEVNQALSKMARVNHQINTTSPSTSIEFVNTTLLDQSFQVHPELTETFTPELNPELEHGS